MASVNEFFTHDEIIDLLVDFEEEAAANVKLNPESSNPTLIGADVSEWDQGSAAGPFLAAIECLDDLVPTSPSAFDRKDLVSVVEKTAPPNSELAGSNTRLELAHSRTNVSAPSPRSRRGSRSKVAESETSGEVGASGLSRVETEVGRLRSEMSQELDRLDGSGSMSDFKRALLENTRRLRAIEAALENLKGTVRPAPPALGTSTASAESPALAPHPQTADKEPPQPEQQVAQHDDQDLPSARTLRPRGAPSAGARSVGNLRTDSLRTPATPTAPPPVAWAMGSFKSSALLSPRVAPSGSANDTIQSLRASMPDLSQRLASLDERRSTMAPHKSSVSLSRSSSAAKARPVHDSATYTALDLARPDALTASALAAAADHPNRSLSASKARPAASLGSDWLSSSVAAAGGLSAVAQAQRLAERKEKEAPKVRERDRPSKWSSVRTSMTSLTQTASSARQLHVQPHLPTSPNPQHPATAPHKTPDATTSSGAAKARAITRSGTMTLSCTTSKKVAKVLSAAPNKAATVSHRPATARPSLATASLDRPESAPKQRPAAGTPNTGATAAVSGAATKTGSAVVSRLKLGKVVASATSSNGYGSPRDGPKLPGSRDKDKEREKDSGGAVEAVLSPRTKTSKTQELQSRVEMTLSQWTTQKTPIARVGVAATPRPSPPNFLRASTDAL